MSIKKIRNTKECPECLIRSFTLLRWQKYINLMEWNDKISRAQHEFHAFDSDDDKFNVYKQACERLQFLRIDQGILLTIKSNVVDVIGPWTFNGDICDKFTEKSSNFF